MTLPAPARSNARGAVTSLVTLLGGIPLAVIPAATLSISAHVYPLEEQGVIAVLVLVGTFVAQLSSGAIIESRLSTPGLVRHVTFPRWLAWLSLAAAAVLVVLPTTLIALCVALPILLAALEVGRGVSVAERLDTREMWSAILVGLGALVGVVIALFDSPWGIIPLALGMAGATLIRARPVGHTATRADPTVRAWILADVGMTGAIYPALNFVILALLGPAPAIVFTAISTVSGLLAIPINFMRTRLLKEHSGLEIVVSVGSLLVAIIAIAIAEFTGVFELFFHSAWTLEATVLPLAAACLWRSASILSTLPFASLRRQGSVRIVTVLRGVAAGATFLGAVLVVQTQQIVWVFVVFFAGELLQAVLYESARRRIAAGLAEAELR